MAEDYKKYFVANGRKSWYSDEGDDFDWDGFQKWMQFSDEEIAAWKADPNKMQATPHMFGNGIVDKWLCMEVVKSHGCGNGHRPGDRLWWRACGHLVTELSDDWCGHNMMYTGLMQDAVHNLIMQGKDPAELYPDHCSCVDSTCQYGWGYVETRVFVVDDKDLWKYFTEGYNKVKYDRYMAKMAEIKGEVETK